LTIRPESCMAPRRKIRKPPRSRPRQRKTQVAPPSLAVLEENDQPNPPEIDEDVTFDADAAPESNLSTVPTVVGVGASAGGLEAFSQLLESLPDSVSFSFVFIQHLSPQHESALPALLGEKTRLPVVQVTDGMRIEPGHVYVIPPNVQMGISDSTLHLRTRTAGTRFASVD